MKGFMLPEALYVRHVTKQAAEYVTYKRTDSDLFIWCDLELF